MTHVAPSGAEWGAVPYLNGGLFERDATDETDFPLPVFPTMVQQDGMILRTKF